jgi:hypothetical protein
MLAGAWVAHTIQSPYDNGLSTRLSAYSVVNTLQVVEPCDVKRLA